MPEDPPSDRNERLALLQNATQNFTSNIYSFIVPKDVTKEIGMYTVAVLIIRKIFLCFFFVHFPLLNLPLNFI